MKIEIRETQFDPWIEMAQFQKDVLDPASGGQYGATGVFVGTMRDLNEGDAISRMFLEHYPQMTEAHLEKISQEAKEQWELFDTLILHRVGWVEPNDPIVLVSAWSAHRGAAIEAAKFLIEELKSRAPFWKKEEREGTIERWVKKNRAY